MVSPEQWRHLAQYLNQRILTQKLLQDLDKPPVFQTKATQLFQGIFPIEADIARSRWLALNQFLKNKRGLQERPTEGNDWAQGLELCWLPEAQAHLKAHGADPAFFAQFQDPELDEMLRSAGASNHQTWEEYSPDEFQKARTMFDPYLENEWKVAD